MNITHKAMTMFFKHPKGQIAVSLNEKDLAQKKAMLTFMKELASKQYTPLAESENISDNQYFMPIGDQHTELTGTIAMLEDYI